jgi:hypothetical protein
VTLQLCGLDCDTWSRQLHFLSTANGKLRTGLIFFVMGISKSLLAADTLVCGSSQISVELHDSHCSEVVGL